MSCYRWKIWLKQLNRKNLRPSPRLLGASYGCLRVCVEALGGCYTVISWCSGLKPTSLNKTMATHPINEAQNRPAHMFGGYGEALGECYT